MRGYRRRDGNIATGVNPLVSPVRQGVELLPDGKRKEGLAVALRELLETLFGGRVLPFDLHAAIMYATRIPLLRLAYRW